MTNFHFKEIISGLGWVKGIRLKAGRPMGREGDDELKQEEQRWLERWI